MADSSSFETIEKKIFQLEIELQEFRQIFSMSLDLICIADIHSSTFLKVNSAFQRTLGYAEEEFIDKPFSDFIHPDDIESTQKIVKEKLRQGAKVVNFENRYRCKDGSYKWMSWVSHPIPDQGKTYSIARDITDQKQMLKKLNESKKKYKSLFHNAQAALFRTSIDGQLIEINKRYAEIAGYDNVDDCMAEYISKTSWKDPEARNVFLKKIQKTGSVRDYETQIIRKDGTAAWILFSATVFPDQGYIEGSIVNVTDHKRAEESVRQSEALKQKMVANIGDVIVIIDEAGINRYKSPNIEKLFGWKPEEVLGRNTWENIHPDDLASQQDFFKVLMSEANTVKITECRYKCKDGSYKWIEFIGTNLFHDPDICGILGNYHDITHRKAAETSLRESETRFKALHNASFGGIAIHDKGIILECNQGMSDMTGYSVDQLIGMNGLLLLAEQFRPMVMDKILSGYEKPYEAIGQRKNGDEFPIRIEARNIPYKGKNVRTVEFRDITEQKKAEQDREKLKGQLTEAQKIAKVGHYLLDVKKNSWVNSPELNNIFGIDDAFKKDISGWLQIVHPDYRDEMLSYFNDHILIQHQKFNMEYKIADHRTGQEKWVHGLGDLKFDKNNEIKEMFGTIQDITERKQANEKRKELEAQIQQTQKMEAIGTLAGGIAHDFNNILSGILGYSELAQIDMGTPEKAAKHIEQVLKGAHRAIGLTRQILTFSRQSEYQKQPFEIGREIKEALKLLRSSIPSTIEIKTRIDSQKRVLADPIKIHQVIMNLCTNSYHAMRKTGGDLTVSLTDVEISKSNLIKDMKVAPGEYIKLEVSDTGHGMDKKTLDRAFEPYFTTKEKGDGTGFGLALVQAIVEEHDGFWEVISEPAQGTNFFIYFPIVQEEINDNAPHIAQEFQLTGNETIMVVDDEGPIRKSCKLLMEDYGYQVQTFSNGIDALEAFKINPAKFDLIVTDMTMPGLTGDKFAIEVLKIKPALPIVLCTGFNENISQKETIEIGIKKFIQKPILNQDLLVLIRKIFDKNGDKIHL